jgi:uncharacterized membrane protein YphA (DoxX/SURF4 family)
MEILGIILIVYGSLILAGLLLQFPFFYNNPKSKAFIKMLGRKGYNILLIIIAMIAIIGGVLLV